MKVGSGINFASGSARPNALRDALIAYKETLVAAGNETFTDEAEKEVTTLIEGLQAKATSITAQRDAFSDVRKFVDLRLGGLALDTETDLRARQDARAKARLPLFPMGASSILSQAPVPATTEDEDVDERMLDVEVIAIYW
jgi:hypothetical protein